MKKQTEIDSSIKDNGICFITALWNVYPEVFEYDENKLKKVVDELKDEDLDITQMLKYFMNYTKRKCDFDFKYFDKDNSTYSDFINFILSKKQELLILTINSNHDKTKMHSVNIIEYNDIDNILYFENGNGDVIISYMIYGLKHNIKHGKLNGLDKDDVKYLSVTRSNEDFYNYIKNKYTSKKDNYTEINSKLLYESSHQLIFVWVNRPKNNLTTFSTRLSLLKLPKMGKLSSEVLTDDSDDMIRIDCIKTEY